MTVPLATRRRVYLAAKTIFSGADAQVRRRKIIVKMVHSCSGKLDPLLREFGEPMLVDILRKLLEDRIFELTLRAKAEFPELFAASLRDAEREASEAEAASSTQGALDELQSGDEDEEAKELPEQMHPAEEYVPKRDIPPPDWPATTPSIPSLYPSYIPYQSQHLLLTTSQQILEECCFDFAAKWLPDIVRENGWDCPAAVELTEWNKIMGTKHYDRIPPLALDLSGSTLTQLLAKTHMLRHTAVHRLPTPARGISQLLDCAVQLAGALQDHKRAAQLEQLKSEVDSKIQAMELTKNFLENDTSSKLDDIRRQREELDRRERELIANMVRQDREDKALVGKLLMESVGRVLGEGMGMLLMVGWGQVRAR
ncbi:hypothetical protein B0T10DRAFT_532044 [Thelonectria olida]|uniref:Ubiquinol-cytochrome-c reductase cytochrome c1 n=1 Tax=Thelonectria olida TaxID=1576542 RepID=A0A9P8VV13_9HYPO|nr:hypothetical protein B0T10DRAFT_532044 [Thelonectria olida]